MTALTPQQMRDRADENAEWAQTAFGLPGREQDARELLLNADMFRAAADQLEAAPTRAQIAEALHDQQKRPVRNLSWIELPEWAKAVYLDMADAVLALSATNPEAGGQ